MRRFLALAATALLTTAHAAPLAPEVDAMLKQVRADSLRGHLSFIASDLLEGRGSPSRGLDLAAEYIAAQFRRAGLEPVGDDGYFQTANWLYTEANLHGFKLVLHAGKEQTELLPKQVSFTPGPGADLKGGAIVKVDFASTAPQPGIAGKVVLTEYPVRPVRSEEEYNAVMAERAAFAARMAAFKPALVLALNRANPNGNGGGSGRLQDPALPAPKENAMPVITLHGPAAIAFYDKVAKGEGATLDLTLAPSSPRPVKLRNVAGVLRGSDPVLKDSYVMLTAHYDHLGARDSATGRTVFNGANDDGSGTVSVMEIAAAMANMPQRPKRSILFMTVFGEEHGMLGSHYYGRHPLVPIAATVADVNLEQVGRTDDAQGPQVNRAALTGYDFSDMGAIFTKAGVDTGIEVFKHKEYSDVFFARSDNQALADKGVPAHTLSVAYEFADYHAPGDHWQKIDYDNMARVDRMVALGLWTIANDARAPQWNAANAQAAPYLKARQAGK